MRAQRILFGASTALVLSMLASGCTWSRVETNPGIRSLDTSFIVVGKTDWREVLRKLGPPDVPLKNLKAFHYKARDRRLTGLLIGYWIFLPFQWGDTQRVTEILIECEDDGRVSSVVRSTRDTIRPPLQGQGSRESIVTEIDMGGGS